MSYEGYSQRLCANGHYYETDFYNNSIYGEDTLCPHCGSSAIWHNEVDQTNGPEVGEIPLERLTVDAEAVVETCPTCKRGKVLQEERYKIPSPEETEAWRTYPEE